LNQSMVRSNIGLFGEGDCYLRLFSDMRAMQRVAKLLEYQLERGSSDRKTLQQNSNVIDIKSRRPQDRSEIIENDTVFLLSEKIGRKHCILLYLLGFKTISDISRANPIAIASIPNIGQVRFSKIRDFLRELGYDYQNPKEVNSGFDVEAEDCQYSLDL
jgi:hypothetical protein